MLEKRLKEYKENMAYIEVTKMRINIWKQILETDDSDIIAELFERTSESTLGMPHQKGLIFSPTERIVENKDVQKREVQKWIDDETSKLLGVELETNEITLALKSLNEEESLVIDRRYFERLFWDDVLKEYNRLFRNEKMTDVTDRTVKRICDNAKQKLKKILGY